MAELWQESDCVLGAAIRPSPTATNPGQDSGAQLLRGKASAALAHDLEKRQGRARSTLLLHGYAVSLSAVPRSF
ncbi:hypothetical protein NDU88_002330 [Pleurodeles waltl]|uniref:Uncharacterized protein n=1 Tax=Pleurodeles waltl TaxID=8319 RepID=A0AAV7VEK8_PLEWA|nr:hypothetical protein NDU88_002329 [Pleurodeles waltl]KAJ1198489.1 hypothetical protein NDU88_002330 [Pleurodeles waltl]